MKNIFRLLIRSILFSYRLILRLRYLKIYQQSQKLFSDEENIFKQFRSQFDFGQELPQSMRELHQEWSHYADRHFDSAHPDVFYTSWNGNAGLLNIAANIYDQFSRFELFIIFEKYLNPKKSFLDIGCGTAAIYWHKACEFSSAALVDVNNLAKEYVQFKISKQDIINIKILLPENLDEMSSASIEQIACIDVIEHLVDSSQIFIQQIDRILKPGGLLFLQAPFGGGVPEHIPEAYENWVSGGGRDILLNRYDKIEIINPLIELKPGCISSIYRKKIN